MRDGVGRDGSKKCKPILAPSRGTGLKSCPITFTRRENPHGTKWGGAGQAERGKIAIPTFILFISLLLNGV